MINFLDKKENLDLRCELVEAFEKVLESGKFVLSREVEKFEKEICSYIGTRFSCGVGNGTDAITLALLAKGIGTGSSVITTTFCTNAVTNGILRAGAEPILVDIEPDTYHMNPNAVEKIAKDADAILVVHMYGQSANVGSLLNIAEKNNLIVIDDAVQSLGGDYMGKKLGSFGDLGVLSFSMSKILPCLGDGGMVLTDSEKMIENLRMLRNHGQRSGLKHSYRLKGMNSRLDEIQAAFLRVKLKRFEANLEKRIKVANNYIRLFGDFPGIPKNKGWGRHVFSHFVIRIPERDALHKFLRENGIVTFIVYPTPIHKQLSMKEYDTGMFPVAEKVSREVLSIPVHPGITIEQQEYIVEKIKSFSSS